MASSLDAVLESISIPVDGNILNSFNSSICLGFVPSPTEMYPDQYEDHYHETDEYSLQHIRLLSNNDIGVVFRKATEIELRREVHILCHGIVF